MSIPSTSAAGHAFSLDFNNQNILKNYGFSMPTTDLRAFLELLQAQKNKSVKYAKPSVKFMHFENEPIIDTEELTNSWPLLLCDAYKGFYMDNDMKLRLGEVKGVNASHQEIKGYTDEFGNLSTAANLDIAFRNDYIFDGEIIEGRTRYINMLFGPYVNDDNQIATDLEWWNDYKSYVRKSIYAENAFSRENLLRTSAGATWRGGSFKQVNDNIMLMQKLYENVTGIVSTYMTEYDLSIFMQEGYDGYEDNSSPIYRRQFYCPLLFNIDKSLSVLKDKSYTYTYGVVNAALSVYNDQQKEFFEPFKFPLSSYWRPYYNFDYQTAERYQPYYLMLLEQHCSPIFTNNKWTYNGKDYDAHSVKNIIRYDDYAGAAASKWKRIETFRYFQAFYFEPGFGYNNLDYDIDWSLWDAILRALRKLDEMNARRGKIPGRPGASDPNDGLGFNNDTDIDDDNDGGCQYAFCLWHSNFNVAGIRLSTKFHIVKLGRGEMAKALRNIILGTFNIKDQSKRMGNQATQKTGMGGNGDGGRNIGSNGSASPTRSDSDFVSQYGGRYGLHELHPQQYNNSEGEIAAAYGAELPLIDEDGNQIVYPASDYGDGLKYSASPGIANFNPIIYGGPHGEFYSPNTPQAYFERQNAFWKNVPRIGLADDNECNIKSINTLASNIKNGFVFSYKDYYYENNNRREFTKLDLQSFINAKWKIYRVETDANKVGTPKSSWWNSLKRIFKNIAYFDKNADKGVTQESYVLEFDNDLIQEQFISYLQKRSINPFLQDKNTDSALNFTFIQKVKNNFIQLFRTNVYLESRTIYNENLHTYVSKLFIKVDMLDNPVYQLDLRDESVFDTDQFYENYLKNTTENNYENYEELAHPMYYSRQDKRISLSYNEYVSDTSDCYIEGSGILGCIKGIDSNVQSNVIYDNKNIMSSHDIYDDISYKQLSYFEEVPTSEYVQQNGVTYYYPNRTSVIEHNVPFDLNVALLKATNKVLVSIDYEADKIYHSNNHFEQYEVTEFGPLELDIGDTESYVNESQPSVYKGYSLQYAVRLLLSNMLKYKSSLESTIEVFKLINFDSIRLVIKQCIDPEVIYASQTLPKDVDRENPNISKHFNYWIHKAITLFGDITLDTNTYSRKSKFMDMLYDRKNKTIAAINLLMPFLSSSNIVTYNDLMKVNSALTIYNDMIKDETLDEWFTVYLHVLYQYRRYFINGRFNKQDGTLLRTAALERILPIMTEYSKIQPGFNADLQVDNVQEDMRVYYKQIQNTLYMKSQALIQGIELEPDKVKYIFIKVDYVPNMGSNIGQNDWVSAKDYKGGEGVIIKITAADDNTMSPGFYTYHSGLLREVVWVPYRARWAFKPIDGKYELISAEVQKNKEDASYNKEWLEIAGVTEEVELQDNGYKNLRRTFKHDDCIFHIKFEVEKTTTDYNTEWSASKKEQLGTETDCAIYFNYMVGIDPDILKARMTDETLSDTLCEYRKCIDLWGIKIPEIKMPINEHYISDVKLVPVFDVVSDVQTVVGGITTNTLYPIEEREYGIENGIHLADDLIAAYNAENGVGV